MGDESFLEVKAERGSLRCPYCHDALAKDEALETCEHCKAGHHDECWGLHGGCSACGHKVEEAPRVRVRGGMRIEAAPDRMDIIWGDRQTTARRVLTIGVVLTALGLLGLFAVFAGGDPALLMLTFYGGLPGIIALIFQLFGIPRSGRLRLDASGIRVQRMSWTVSYEDSDRLDWTELDQLTERKVSGGFAVVDPEKPERVLARTKTARRARSIRRQVQGARSLFHRTIPPGAIRVRPAEPEESET